MREDEGGRDVGVGVWVWVCIEWVRVYPLYDLCILYWVPVLFVKG